MKTMDILKKTAFLTMIAACSFSVTVSASNNSVNSYENEVTYGETIQFSPYEISQGTEKRVKNPSFDASETAVKNIMLDKGTAPKWEAGVLGWSDAGRAENDCKVIVYQNGSSYKIMDIDVKIEDVPAGYYDVYQYTPYVSNPFSITVSSDEGSKEFDVPEEKNSNGEVGNGTWQALGSVYISGDTTFEYYCNMSITTVSTRVDQTRLVKRTDSVYATGEDVDGNSDGNSEASVWTATLTGYEGNTYSGVEIKATDKTGKSGLVEAVGDNETTVSGAGSVFVAMAANKPVSEIDSVLVTLK